MGTRLPLLPCRPSRSDPSPMQPVVTIAVRAARRAGQIILRAFDRLERVIVEEKGEHDLVSEVDREAEAAIIETLRGAYPQHGVLAEESGATHEGSSGYTWIIDPLDGTTNFLHGIPHFCISIALAKGNKVEHGVVFDPIRNEIFYASRGYGAQLNDKRIRVSQRNEMNAAVLGTGIPFRDVDQYLPAYLPMLDAMSRQCRGIRRMGSAALDLAYVAAGRFEGFWEIGLKPWDIAAGVLLVEESGGLVSDLAGKSRHMETGNILVANKKIYKEMLRALRPHLPEVFR